MRIWLRVTIGTALAAFLLGIVLRFLQPDDPATNGRLASEWARDLLSQDYKVRDEAQAALLSLGESAVPQVCVLLRESDPLWQPYATKLSTSLPFLQPNGRDRVLARQRGAEMISLLGPKGREAVPELVRCLGLPGAAMEAERALLRIGDSSVPALTKALRHHKPEVRARSAHLLKDFVGAHPATVRPLVGATADTQPNVRREAALALAEVKDADASVFTALLRITSDPATEVRAAAYEALGRLGNHSEELIALVRTGMRDPFPSVRLESAKALWSLTHDEAEVVPVLIGILPTQEGWQATYALGQMGPLAKAAVPALIEVLKHEKVPRAFRTPPSSSLALGQIREPAIPALEQVLANPEPGVRLAAVLAFGFMGKNASAAIPRLLTLLQDPETEVRHVTAITLAGIGAKRELIIAGLSDCLKAEDIYVRSAAAAFLRDIAPEQDWVVGPE